MESKLVNYKNNRAGVIELFHRLKKEYPDAGCELNHDSIFHLLLAVVLSAQTTDVNVNKVTPKLFEKYKDAESLSQATTEDIIKIIKTLGYYNSKSKHLIGIGKMLVEDFDNKVPQDMELLQKLPGVGRKTANVVLSVGFGEQHIAVDTHVFRVSNRIGLVKEKDVLKTEKALMKVLPENTWSDMHHLLIFHGRRKCSARKPKCETCVIKDMCHYYKRDYLKNTKSTI